MFWKSLLLCAVFLITVQANFTAFLKLLPDCLKKEQATNEDFETLKKYSEIPTQKAKCLKACFMEETKILTPEHKLNAAVMLEHCNEISKKTGKPMKLTQELIEKCNNEVTENERCETAYKLGKCVWKSVKDDMMT